VIMSLLLLSCSSSSSSFSSSFSSTSSGAPPGEISDTKRSEEKLRFRAPVGTPLSQITVCACVTCGLQLHVPKEQTLLTCPACRTVMNPYNRDLRFMQCASCRSLLQYPLSTLRGSSDDRPMVRCGKCDTPNHVPHVVRPTRASLSGQGPMPLLVGFVGAPIYLYRGAGMPVHSAPSHIQSLPTHRYKKRGDRPEKDLDNVECSFCLSEFEEGDTVKTLPCFHMFHQDEVDKWLTEHTECPICKTSVI